ncbi:MAG: hypothetical protein WCI72_03060 [archaeon]
MALEDYFPTFVKYAEKAKASITRNPNDAVDYLIKYELSDYFGKDASAVDRASLRSGLEKTLEESRKKYSDELDGFIRKTGSKGSAMLNMYQQLHGYITGASGWYIAGAGLVLGGIKALWELPSMYKYLKKSHDWYGAMTHYLLTPVRSVLPVVGPALEAGAFERMVMKKVMKEAKYNFIKKYGDYTPASNLAQERMKMKIGDVIFDAEESRKAA